MRKFNRENDEKKSSIQRRCRAKRILSQEQRDSRRNIILIAVLEMVISITIIIISIIWRYYNKVEWVQIFCEVTLLLASTGFTIGIASILYGFFDMVHFAEKRIFDALFKNDGYLNLSVEQKIDMRKKLNEDLLLSEINTEKGLYNTVEKEVYPLIKEVYCEIHKINVDCTVAEHNGRLCIIKKITKTMLLRNPDLKDNIKSCPNLDTLLGMRFKNEDQNDYFDVVSLKINGVQHKDSYNKCQYDLHHKVSDYQQGISINLNNPSLLVFDENNSLEIEIIYNTYVDLDDNTYVYKIVRPSKDFEIRFNYDSNFMNVSGDGFGFMDSNNNRVKYSRFNTSVDIQFNNWVLPGDGVFFNINILKDKLQKQLTN